MDPRWSLIVWSGLLRVWMVNCKNVYFLAYSEAEVWGWGQNFTPTFPCPNFRHSQLILAAALVVWVLVLLQVTKLICNVNCTWNSIMVTIKSFPTNWMDHPVVGIVHSFQTLSYYKCQHASRPQIYMWCSTRANAKYLAIRIIFIMCHSKKIINWLKKVK